jgi:RNA polymerase sigma factor (sigma-70 family)
LKTPSTGNDSYHAGRTSVTTMEDMELIRGFLDTRKQAYFDQLYKRYMTKIYSKCISMLRNEARAIDATQEVFMKIYLNLAKFDERSKFSTWIYSITYNYCIDFIRKQKKETKLFVDDQDDLPDIVIEVPDTALLEMEVKRLKVVLEKLRPDDRAILLMKYQDEMQIKEIAVALGKTESAIKMKIKRAKHKAQKVYQDIFPTGL